MSPGNDRRPIRRCCMGPRYPPPSVHELFGEWCGFCAGYCASRALDTTKLQCNEEIGPIHATVVTYAASSKQR